MIDSEAQIQKPKRERESKYFFKMAATVDDDLVAEKLRDCAGWRLHVCLKGEHNETDIWISL